MSNSLNTNFNIILCAWKFRKRSPEIGFGNLERECEPIQADFDCEPVEQLSEMEVDDIAINDDELKSDNELCAPITSDPFVEPPEPKQHHFNEGMFTSC